MKKFENNMIKIIINLALFFLIIFNANAYQTPRYLGVERKFRSFVYNPNDIYRYTGHYTYQGFIEFGEGEEIKTISMGNSSAWLFETLSNRLFLKPVADNADTNMTVITSNKIYHFDLTAKEAKGIDDEDLVFVVKFIYPDEKDKNILKFAKVPKTDVPDLRDPSIYNFNYDYTGEPTIAPIKVFDDGKFTYFEFSDKNAEIPAIFNVDSAGFESIVNFRVAGNYIIVERVSSQFTLRSGNDIVCVYNNRLSRAIIDPKDRKEALKRSSVNRSNALPATSFGQSSSPLMAPPSKQGGRPVFDINSATRTRGGNF